MRYAKKQLGLELKNQLDKGYDIVGMARWAHHEVFLSHSLKLEAGLKEFLMQLMAMEAGSEFEFSESELREKAEEFANS